MSVRVSQDVWAHSKVGGTDLLVLLKLADNANEETRIAWPSVTYLAEHCRVSRRTVQRSLRTLEDAGEIETAENENGTVRRYRILTGVRQIDAASLETQGGVTRDAGGASPVSPEPSVQPSGEPAGTDAHASGALFDAPSEGERRLEVVWAHYTTAVGCEGKVMAPADGRVITAALRARPLDVVLRAIDGLAASDFHNGRGPRSDGRKWLAIRYALHGNQQRRESDGERIDTMAALADAATEGNGRLLRLAHSTADLGVYDAGIVEA